MDIEALSPLEAFDLAVTRAGSQSALAKICGCTPGNINQLLLNKRQLPAEYVLPVEAATGVPRWLLRPDIYPRGLQDGVPFTDDPLVPPLVAEDAGGNQETPLAPSPGQHSCDSDDKLQAAGAGR